VSELKLVSKLSVAKSFCTVGSLRSLPIEMLH
jgi:hypothetical protein